MALHKSNNGFKPYDPPSPAGQNSVIATGTSANERLQSSEANQKPSGTTDTSSSIKVDLKPLSPKNCSLSKPQNSTVPSHAQKRSSPAVSNDAIACSKKKKPCIKSLNLSENQAIEIPNLSENQAIESPTSIASRKSTLLSKKKKPVEVLHAQEEKKSNAVDDAAPKKPWAPFHGMKQKFIIQTVDENSLAELSKYRKCTEKPPFSISALVKCCFLESGGSPKTFEVIIAYLKGFCYFQNQNKETSLIFIENVRKALRLSAFEKDKQKNEFRLSTNPLNKSKESNKGKRTNINDIDDKSLSDLAVYRNSNDEPPYSIAALIKCCYLESSKSIRTLKEVFQYIKEFGFYKDCSYNRGDKVYIQIKATLAKSPQIFQRKAIGIYKLLQSECEDAEEHLPRALLQKDDRPFKKNLTFDLPVVKGTFILDRYKWFIKFEREVKTAVCMDCCTLYAQMIEHHWMIGGQKIPKEQCARMPIIGKKIYGCPWRPYKIPHFCRNKVEYRRRMGEQRVITKFHAIEELKDNLYEKAEKRMEDLAAQLSSKIKEFPKTLVEFLEEHAKCHPRGRNEKVAALYILRVKDEEQPQYYGISTDIDSRDYRHTVKEMLTAKGLVIETIVAPLGIQNLSFVQDLEASLIQLTKKKEIFPQCDIVNLDNGKFESIDKELKNVIENKSHPKHADLVKAMRQLVEVTMKHGLIIEKSEERPTREYIYQTESRSRHVSTLKDQMFRPSSPALQQSTAFFASSQTSQTISSETPSLQNYPVAKELLQELHNEHPQSIRQRPSFLYFMILPETHIIKRFGISHDISMRERQHVWNDTIKGEFEMITVPLGRINNLFAMDLEALFIRLSKKKLLNDGKENANHHLDNGFFSTNYQVFAAHLNETSDRRQFLISGLNEIIEWTFKSKK